MANNNQDIVDIDEDGEEKLSNSGNFAENTNRASEAGKKGAAAQPTEAKRRGGRNSHRNG